VLPLQINYGNNRKQHRIGYSSGTGRMSEGNQAARSNCSSSRRCHRSAHRGSTWFLLSRCKDRNYFSKMQVFWEIFYNNLL